MAKWHYVIYAPLILQDAYVFVTANKCRIFHQEVNIEMGKKNLNLFTLIRINFLSQECSFQHVRKLLKNRWKVTLLIYRNVTNLEVLKLVKNITKINGKLLPDFCTFTSKLLNPRPEWKNLTRSANTHKTDNDQEFQWNKFDYVILPFNSKRCKSYLRLANDLILSYRNNILCKKSVKFLRRYRFLPTRCVKYLPWNLTGKGYR